LMQKPHFARRRDRTGRDRPDGDEHHKPAHRSPGGVRGGAHRCVEASMTIRSRHDHPSKNSNDSSRGRSGWVPMRCHSHPKRSKRSNLALGLILNPAPSLRNIFNTEKLSIFGRPRTKFQRQIQCQNNDGGWSMNFGDLTEERKCADSSAPVLLREQIRTRQTRTTKILESDSGFSADISGTVWPKTGVIGALSPKIRAAMSRWFRHTQLCSRTWDKKQKNVRTGVDRTPSDYAIPWAGV